MLVARSDLIFQIAMPRSRADSSTDDEPSTSERQQHSRRSRRRPFASSPFASLSAVSGRLDLSPIAATPPPPTICFSRHRPTHQQTQPKAPPPTIRKASSDKPLTDVIAGALARAASQSTIHPLDTLKVRIQAGRMNQGELRMAGELQGVLDLQGGCLSERQSAR